MLILFFLKTAQSLYCYVCSSEKLEQCSTLHSLKELPNELCPTDVASCFTKVKGDLVCTLSALLLRPMKSTEVINYLFINPRLTVNISVWALS